MGPIKSNLMLKAMRWPADVNGLEPPLWYQPWYRLRHPTSP